MSRPQIDGYAIVSREGMIANADGSFPKALKIDADQRFFRNALSQANAIANGRHSNEGDPEALARPRLVVTRRIDTLAVDTDNVKVVLWNPNGASLNNLGGTGLVDRCQSCHLGTDPLIVPVTMTVTKGDLGLDPRL